MEYRIRLIADKNKNIDPSKVIINKWTAPMYISGSIYVGTTWVAHQKAMPPAQYQRVRKHGRGKNHIVEITDSDLGTGICIINLDTSEEHFLPFEVTQQHYEMLTKSPAFIDAWAKLTIEQHHDQDTRI